MDLKKKITETLADRYPGLRSAVSSLVNDPGFLREPAANPAKGKPEHFNVMRIAEKLIQGDTTIQPGRFQPPEAACFRSDVFEPALADLMELSVSAAERERSYRKASIIIQSYYANDRIRDFLGDLLEAWDQELTDEDPRGYANELHSNSLVPILRQFRRMQEKLLEVDSISEAQVRQSVLDRRLSVLEQYHFSDPDLNALAAATRETREIYDRLTAGRSADEGKRYAEGDQQFVRAADHLASLFLNKRNKITTEKLAAFSDAIRETIRMEETRFAQMQPDIDKAQRLYSCLRSALTEEENVRLMESLNPRSAELAELSVEQIRDRYRPLMEQLTAITAEFRK